MESRRIAEVKIAFETQIQGDLVLGSVNTFMSSGKAKKAVHEGMCMLLLFDLIFYLVLN